MIDKSAASIWAIAHLCTARLPDLCLLSRFVRSRTKIGCSVTKIYELFGYPLYPARDVMILTPSS
jgi:hypothetical protein